MEAAVWSVFEAIVSQSMGGEGRGGDVTGCGGEDYEAGPVILD